MEVLVQNQKMFDSEYFNGALRVFYLHKYIEHQEVVLYLLRNMKEHEFNFYLPQICELGFSSQVIQRFLCEKGSRNVMHYVKVNWMVISLGENREQTEDWETIAMVNGNHELGSLDEQQLIQYMNQKQLNIQNSSKIQKFIASLIKFSLAAKSFPVKERNQKLESFLEKLNAKNQNGCYFPFDDASFILRVIPKESKCFSTKTRVPYKVLFECIDQHELEFQNVKIERNVQEVLSNEVEFTIAKENGLNKFNGLQEFMNKMSKKKQPKTVTQRRKSLNIIQNKTYRSLSMAQFKKVNTIEFINNQLEFSHDQNNIQKWLDLKLYFQQNNHTKTKSILKTKTQQSYTEELNHKLFYCPSSAQKYFDIKRASPYGHFKSYRLRSYMVKGGDDLRQEIIAMQLIKTFKRLFIAQNIQLQPYEIIVTSHNSGLIEFIEDTYSIDWLKKQYDQSINLYQIYKDQFVLEEAQKNFTESLAGYCLVQYFLQLKDRHNGNILIDRKGRIIHIDFGFLLGMSPGGVNFETSPFKLTSEYIELLGGTGSSNFQYFKKLLIEGMVTIIKNQEEILKLIQIMLSSQLVCFQNFNFDYFKKQLFSTQIGDVTSLIDKLIYRSQDNWRTYQYDVFQYKTNGIMP